MDHGGYSGQFLSDVLAAFTTGPSIDGDYDGDGDVDGDDFEIWAASVGQTGSGLAADGNANGVIDAGDYTLWRDNAVLPTAGDFNGDGAVDAADFTLWRNTRGQTGPDLAADANGDGAVDDLDYQLWAATYGQASAGPSIAVPETSAASLAALMTFSLAATRHRRRGPQEQWI